MASRMRVTSLTPPIKQNSARGAMKCRTPRSPGDDFLVAPEEAGLFLRSTRRQPNDSGRAVLDRARRRWPAHLGAAPPGANRIDRDALFLQGGREHARDAVEGRLG